MKRLKKHPFYSANLAAYGLIKLLTDIQDDSIREIIEALPAEWIGKSMLAKTEAEARRLIAERLIVKKQNSVALHKRLDLLRVLKVETTEEARLRNLENIKSFEKKYGKL